MVSKYAVIAAVLGCFTLGLTTNVFAGIDPQNVVGPEKCIECHKGAGRAWQGTHHFATFTKMHKEDKAKTIADKMGVKSIKSEPTCMGCHYTVDSTEKAISGISCESCHGAAKGWVKIHNDFGGKNVKRDAETPDHKSKRIADSVAAGMIRPEDIYHVAQNCYQCHTVPNEKLVEKGGHTAGSDFELVSWSQGEVRHGFQKSNDKSNDEATPERKRILYVVGRVLDLEYGLRGVAEVTGATGYAVKMAKRTKQALGHVDAINKALKDADLGEIYAIGKGAALKPNNKAALTSAADSISQHAQAFLSKNATANLSAVDSLIPGTTKGKATQ